MSRRSPSARLSIPAVASTSSSAASSAAVTFTLTAETGIAASAWRSASALSVYWIARGDTPNRSANTDVDTPSAASRTISMRSASVSRFERDMRRKTPYFLPPSTKAALPYDNITNCQLYTDVAFSLRQPWCLLPPRPAGARLCRPHHRATHLSNGSPSPAPPEGLAEHARVRTEPRAGANPPDRADRQGQGGPDLACQISAAKTGRPWPIGFCGWPP